MPDADTALHATSLQKSYGSIVALDDVSLAVARGSCTALVGESGSGKTTLLRTFNSMVKPDRGSVTVDGMLVGQTDHVRLRRSIGYVQQEGGLLPHWPVLRNVALVPWLNGMQDAEARSRDALELVGLPPAEFADRWPRELSGGQRQRAALARAISGGPRVLLLDEPFGALDAITRVEVQRSFGALRRSLELTVLLVTHDLREAFHLADEVAVMRSGRIEQIASAPELRDSPASAYVTELLDKAGVL